MEELFGIEKFNLIQDEENYYFFRALNMADNRDIEEGITLNEENIVIFFLRWFGHVRRRPIEAVVKS